MGTVRALLGHCKQPSIFSVCISCLVAERICVFLQYSSKKWLPYPRMWRPVYFIHTSVEPPCAIRTTARVVLLDMACRRFRYLVFVLTTHDLLEPVRAKPGFVVESTIINVASRYTHASVKSSARAPDSPLGLSARRLGLQNGPRPVLHVCRQVQELGPLRYVQP